MRGSLGRCGGVRGTLPPLPPAPCLADKVKKDGSECQDWRWGPCVPNSKDCGLGYREGTCGDESKKLKCKIPCNWKKKFGGVGAAGGWLGAAPGAARP